MLRLPRLLLLLVAACGSSSRSAAPPAPAATPPATAATPAPTPAGKKIDGGTFVFELQGKAVGKERFEIFAAEDGHKAIVTETTLAVGPLSFVTSGFVGTDEAWHPLVAQLSGTVSDKPFTITGERSDDGLFQVTAEQGGQKNRHKSSRPIELFVNDNTMTHLAPLCAVPPGEAGQRVIWPDTDLKFTATRPLPLSGREVGVRQLDFGGHALFDILCERGQLVGVNDAKQAFRAYREGDSELAATLAAPPRAKPPTPDTVVELARQVKAPAAAGAGEAVLDCTLVLPAAYADIKKRPAAHGKTPPLPAVVFITGSGPQDRDGDGIGGLPPTLSVFKVMAVKLGEAGVASLRCDDLGVGKSTGDGKLGTRQVFTALVNAEAAALRDEPAVDPGRIGLVGHSEGGLLAPLAAAVDPSLHVLVLMAAPGRPLDALVLEQVEGALRAGGASDDQIKQQLDKTRAVFAALRQGQPLPDTLSKEERSAWEAGAPWFKSYLDFDPVTLARTLKKPAVLITQGQLDKQVGVADSELLEKAFRASGNRKIVRKLYPELNHLFARSKTGDIKEYSDPDAHVDDDFVADVVTFVVKYL